MNRYQMSGEGVKIRCSMCNRCLVEENSGYELIPDVWRRGEDQVVSV